MNRAPFQVLVLPFFWGSDGNVIYALFRRAECTGGYWQFIAGGGELGETPLLAAKREAGEEAGIPPDIDYISLDSMAMIPVVKVSGFLWGSEVLVIPEYCFGVCVLDTNMTLSSEHSSYCWKPFQEANELLHWDSNKNALWELDFRLRRLKR